MFKTYTRYYYMTHPWEILFEIRDEIKWAWQRIFRGWDDRVVWSIDHYLFEMMPKWLTQLMETKHGIPMFCFLDTLAVFDENHICSDEDIAIAEVYFDSILYQMIIGFQCGYHLINHDVKAYDEFVEWQIDVYGNKVDWSFDDTSEYRRRSKEFDLRRKIDIEEKALEFWLNHAMKLFYKYHDALWD